MPQFKSQSQPSSESSLRTTLRGDFQQRGFWQRVRQEFEEIRDFYISEEKKTRLASMGWIRRWLYLSIWILKSMLLKLTPTRRILVVVGMLLIFAGRSVEWQDGNTHVTFQWYVFGGIVVLFVLLLELKDKVLARSELEAGKKVQAALMPERSPVVPGWSLWLFTRSANEVGGDLVDFVRTRESRVGLVIADVSGKGLQAALLMAKLQATIRALAPDFESAAELVAKINAVFHRDSLPSIFASMLFVEISPGSGNLRFVNAGHLPPFLLDADGWHEMSKGKPALGLFGDARYTEHNLHLNSGDIFLAYSDGLSEAKNKNGEFFGTDRLLRILPSLRVLPADQIGQALTAEVDIFVGETRTHDDLSLLVLKRV